MNISDPKEIRDPASMADVLRDRFRKMFDSREGCAIVRAPGRVNLIGDHTDYNEGFVLPMTIDRGVYVCAAVRPDGPVRLYSENFGERFKYEQDDRPHVEPSSWTSYAVGVIEELRSSGRITGGLDVLIYGDVPRGSGLSSSAALTVSLAFGLQTAFAFDIEPIDLIRLCQLVEHRYAGVPCGIMDPYCALLGRRGHALFLDCRSLEHEHVPVRLDDAGMAVVIIDSRVSRGLVDSKYGERRAECAQAVDALRSGGRPVRTLRDVDLEWLDEEHERLGDRLMRRTRFVLEENARVRRAKAALRSGDYGVFGVLMNESHEGLRDDFEVSASEVDTLVSEAQRTDGVLGARMTGGGFGGSVVCLVRSEAAERLRQALQTAYVEKHDLRPNVHVLQMNSQTEVLSE